MNKKYSINITYVNNIDSYAVALRIWEYDEEGSEINSFSLSSICGSYEAAKVLQTKFEEKYG